MSFLNQLETRFKIWEGKRGAKRALDSLVDSIGSVNQLLETSGSAFHSVAKQHVDSADRDYRAAIRSFKANELMRCHEFVDRAKLHVEIAHAQLMYGGEGDWELHFDENSADSLVAHFAQSLTGAKLAIEYSNCLTRLPVKQALVTVANFFHQSVDYLLENDDVRAKRAAEGGLLYLYCIGLQLDVDNQRTIFEVHIPHCGNLEKALLELAEELANCQKQFVSIDMAIPDSVRDHFVEAESSLCEAVNAIAEGLTEQADTAIAAASTQVKLAEKLYKTTDAANVSRKNPLPSMVETQEFRTLVKELCRTIRTMKVRQPEVVEKHLQTARTNYESASAEFFKPNFDEADRLARLSYLSLDEAKKCAWFLNI